MKANFYLPWIKYAGIIISFVLPSVLYLLNPFELEHKPLLSLVLSCLMICFWIIEVLPMAVVALAPLVLFPLSKISSLPEVAKSYADPIIFLFMGGFFIAIAIEKWELHKRIALNIILITGQEATKLILGFMLSTFFISMWISNTATTMMMYPIALSIINVVKTSYDHKHFIKLRTALLLCIAYASNIGGLSTIVGTPPNSAFVAFLNERNQQSIGFAEWMKICFPIAIIILIILFLFFKYVLFPMKNASENHSKEFIQQQLQKLGKWTYEQKAVLVVFLITALLWITKDLINDLLKIELSDVIIALIGSSALFAIPCSTNKITANIDFDEKANQQARILDWKDTNKMAWGILLIFGGGLALAKQLESVGLMNKLGDALAVHTSDNIFLLILLVTTVSVFLSEVMSNIAQVIVLSPIILSISASMHLSPLVLGIPMCLGASCAGMMPMGTPPNAIIFGSGMISLKSMMKAGLVVNLISILVITLICYFWFV